VLGVFTLVLCSLSRVLCSHFAGNEGSFLFGSIHLLSFGFSNYMHLSNSSGFCAIALSLYPNTMDLLVKSLNSGTHVLEISLTLIATHPSRCILLEGAEKAALIVPVRNIILVVLLILQLLD